MNLRMLACTRTGCALAGRLARALEATGDVVEVFSPERVAAQTGAVPVRGVGAWARESFVAADALVFVCACGIAVRAIAPCVRDKFCDPAVVCLDERGEHVIALLSGHVGGANDLARRIAALTGGDAVVTTATDVEGVFAVDAWAAARGLAVLDRDEAKRVSALLLDGGTVGLASDVEPVGALPAGVERDEDGRAHETGVCVSAFLNRQPFAHTMRLVPRLVVVGVGCKRGVPVEAVAQRVDACLARAGVAPASVRALATIDAKAREEALVALAAARGWELLTYAADELAAVPGEFASSDFVRRTVGVDNVCERAACAGGGRLVLPRTAGEGVTVALAVEEVTLVMDDSEGAWR